MTARSVSREEVVSILSNLLRLEQAGIFHFMADADPYLNRGAAAIRSSLDQMLEADQKRELEMGEMILDLGGTLRPPPVSPEQQYLAYLSMGYLLPKLVAARELTISRYESALSAVGGPGGQAAAMLANHLEQLRGELYVLQQAAKRYAPHE